MSLLGPDSEVPGASVGVIVPSDLTRIEPASQPLAAGVASHWNRQSRAAVLPIGRRRLGWALAVAGTGGLTAVLVGGRESLDQGSRLLLFQLVVLAAAAIGGAGPAVLAALLSAAALNWFFTPPVHTFNVTDSTDLITLVIFLLVGLVVGVLVTALARRTAEAERGRAEAEALARAAADIATLDDPVPALLALVVETLNLRGAAVMSGDAADSAPLMTAGEPVDPMSGASVDLPDGRLVVRGSLTPDTRRLLGVFASQLASALEQRRLRQQAARAAVDAEADALRVALLRAVSHDLRTPLASIKASATSLLHNDVVFSDADRAELLDTIDDQVDRLDAVVANLLDASRLEAGALTVLLAPVGLADVVAAAVRSSADGVHNLDIDVPPDLPAALADSGLLIRALANLVSNALRVSGGGPVHIAASAVPDAVELRVIDHGPGVDPRLQAQMFEPFQRLGDHPSAEGVGLGLSVARGLVEAMGGRLTPEDTPGGGLTMLISLTRSAR